MPWAWPPPRRCVPRACKPRELSRLARNLTYQVEPGASDAIDYPGAGPFDRRLGYSDLDDFLPRLLKRNYVIQAQSRLPRP